MNEKPIKEKADGKSRMDRNNRRLNQKSVTLLASSARTRGGAGCTCVPMDEITWRKLTVVECERLQTLPDNYTDAVSNSQRYKCLGNGWTVDIIVHILKQDK